MVGDAGDAGEDEQHGAEAGRDPPFYSEAIQPTLKNFTQKIRDRSDSDGDSECQGRPVVAGEKGCGRCRVGRDGLGGRETRGAIARDERKAARDQAAKVRGRANFLR